MTESVTPKQRLNKAACRYHAIYTVLPVSTIGVSGADIVTRDFMSQFADYANRWHGQPVKVTYEWIRHESGTLFFAVTGTRSLLKAFEAYLQHASALDRTHVENYGRRHSEFERDVALLFSPVLHGRHGRGASR